MEIRLYTMKERGSSWALSTAGILCSRSSTPACHQHLQPQQSSCLSISTVAHRVCRLHSQMCMPSSTTVFAGPEHWTLDPCQQRKVSITNTCSVNALGVAVTAGMPMWCRTFSKSPRYLGTHPQASSTAGHRLLTVARVWWDGPVLL